ncbi:Uncharacterized protein TSPI_09798 [Trichinella spiralis]|uniref:Uncharacterized protein n=1 Tax=Trichinella spiralis TaxID=6334 RepID=A0ABR3K7I4_TRISP
MIRMIVVIYFASDAAKMKKQKAACHVKPLKGRQPATTGRRSDAFASTRLQLAGTTRLINFTGEASSI